MAKLNILSMKVSFVVVVILERTVGGLDIGAETWEQPDLQTVLCFIFNACSHVTCLGR